MYACKADLGVSTTPSHWTVLSQKFSLVKTQSMQEFDLQFLQMATTTKQKQKNKSASSFLFFLNYTNYNSCYLYCK